MQVMLIITKEKPIGTYLKLVDSLVKHQVVKSLLDVPGLGNLRQNIYHISDYERDYPLKKNIRAKKQATDLYLQNVHNYSDIAENKWFFKSLKDKHEKERYLDLGNMEITNTLSKLRLSSFKIAMVTGKWFKKKKRRRTNMQIL